MLGPLKNSCFERHNSPPLRFWLLTTWTPCCRYKHISWKGGLARGVLTKWHNRFLVGVSCSSYGVGGAAKASWVDMYPPSPDDHCNASCLKLASCSPCQSESGRVLIGGCPRVDWTRLPGDSVQDRPVYLVLHWSPWAYLHPYSRLLCVRTLFAVTMRPHLRPR